MGIIRTGGTEYDKEMERWNTPRNQQCATQPGVYGFGAVGFERYPQMLYKAYRRENGRVECMETPPQTHMFLTMPEFLRAEAIAVAFTSRCQTTVRSDAEYERARADGWRDTQSDAVAHVEALEREIADAAAEANFRLKRMSDAAKAEHAAANAETDAHVVDVPAPKKRGPRKRVLVEA